MSNERDRDYLYHCNGCHKADKNYPSEMTHPNSKCEACDGSGKYQIVIDELNSDEDECGECDGYGEYVHRVTPIENHEWARSDAYGIYTGLYCHKCYKDQEKYTYRKDRYFDESYAGERLEPEE